MEHVHRPGLASEAKGDASGHTVEIELQIGSNLSSMIQRVSGASVSEIEKLIAELQGLRDFLLSEGQRVQREITEYGRLNQATMESTRVITESLLKWKAGPDRSSRTTVTVEEPADVPATQNGAAMEAARHDHETNRPAGHGQVAYAPEIPTVDTL